MRKKIKHTILFVKISFRINNTILYVESRVLVYLFCCWSCPRPRCSLRGVRPNHRRLLQFLHHPGRWLRLLDRSISICPLWRTEWDFCLRSSVRRARTKRGKNSGYESPRDSAQLQEAWEISPNIPTYSCTRPRGSFRCTRIFWAYLYVRDTGTSSRFGRRRRTDTGRAQGIQRRRVVYGDVKGTGRSSGQWRRRSPPSDRARGPPDADVLCSCTVVSPRSPPNTLARYYIVA